MSEGLNRVILLGNIGAEPELRQAGSTAVLNIRLATSENYKDRNGEKQERTEWHRISLWGKRGQALSNYLKKGDRILVEGSLRTSSYEDSDGNKKFSTEINASNVVFAGGAKGAQQEEPAPDDDDIPF